MAGYIGNFPTAIPLTSADIQDGTITNSDLANSSVTVNGTSISLGASGTISAGKVLQVVGLTSSTEYSQSNAGDTDCTNYNISITPSSTSSKVLIQMTVSHETTDDNANGNHESDGYWKMRDVTNSTDLLTCRTLSFVSSETRNQRIQLQSSGVYLHSPSTTSQITYSIRLNTNNGYTSKTKGQYSAVLMEIEG